MLVENLPLSIAQIINKKLGEDWIIFESGMKEKSHRWVTLIDPEGYWYNKIMTDNIRNGKLPQKFNVCNPYTIYNIRLWCKLNDKPFELIGDEYKGNKIKLKWKCKKCNSFFEVNWHNISSSGQGCSICSDGTSYGEKFIYSMLNQLNIKYIPEFNTDWTQGKKYDVNIPSINGIIEINGRQHYEEWGFYSIR